jgi:uncharacterized repeat protein (TIGR03803 family)
MVKTSEFGNRTWRPLKHLLAVQTGVLLLCLLAATGRAQVFTTLHTFTGGDRSQPIGSVMLSGNTLYGTTRAGGSSSDGTVFSLSLPPQLTIIPSETNLILTWPTNYAGSDYTGYTLESTTHLAPPVVWVTNSPAPFAVNGQNVVANSITSSQQYFRLSQ